MPLKFNNDLTAEYVRARLDYDPLTGIFTWRDHPDMPANMRGWIGKRAGSIHAAEGRRHIKIKGSQKLAARLAWLYVKGVWPTETIDHEDRDKLNDSFDNLREADLNQQQYNRGVTVRNTSGAPGVSWHAKTQSWKAQTCIDGVNTHLGYRKVQEEAVELYKAANLKHHDPVFVVI